MQKELIVSRASTTDPFLVVHPCRDMAVRMEAPHFQGPVVVDSLLDTAVNKADTILSRAPSEPKTLEDLAGYLVPLADELINRYRPE